MNNICILSPPSTEGQHSAPLEDLHPFICPDHPHAAYASCCETPWEKAGDPPHIETAYRRSFQRGKVLTSGRLGKLLSLLCSVEMHLQLQSTSAFHMTLRADKRGRRGTVCSDFSRICSFPPTGISTHYQGTVQNSSSSLTFSHIYQMCNLCTNMLQRGMFLLSEVVLLS